MSQLKARAREIFSTSCEAAQLSLGDNYFDNLYGVARWLKQQIEGNERRSLGISGAQGSGKSTFSLLLADMMTDLFNIESLVLALDDFYLTRIERQRLGVQVHPLLTTRGVPGTHDIEKLANAKSGFYAAREISIPEFSKSNDDRVAEHRVSTSSLQFLICEGWCWGATPVAERFLSPPINALEKQEDKAAVWRHYVNQALEGYQSVFKTDYSVFLKVPDFDAVRRWRWQQEQGLPIGPRRMNEQQLDRFIMHYERITRQLLDTRPDQVDICLELDESHLFRRSSLGI